jgi:hypothetical protein
MLGQPSHEANAVFAVGFFIDNRIGRNGNCLSVRVSASSTTGNLFKTGEKKEKRRRSRRFSFFSPF